MADVRHEERPGRVRVRVRVGVRAGVRVRVRVRVRLRVRVRVRVRVRSRVSLTNQGAPRCKTAAGGARART